MEFDYIIVGGGSAGAVLANRLSARSAKRVLLCEAGQDTPDGETPEQILDSFAAHAFLDQRFLWNDLRVTTEAMSHNQPDSPRPPLRKYEQARVLGGGSSINGQLANRGSPDDYQEWSERGAVGWDWDGVLPYFRKLERDIDFEGPLHGKEGPIPIRRIFPHLWAEHAKAMAKGFESIGFDYIEDQNGEFRDGFYPMAINNLYDRRVPTSIAYLPPTVRQRSNLTIMTRTEVMELLFDGHACGGVRAVRGGEILEFRGREVILSCGAIHSPAHLLRSGIGPAQHLRDLGIPVLRALPGVGQRLMDHPSIALASFIKRHARLNGKTRRHLLVGLRFTSDTSGAPPSDMGVSISTKGAWHPVGEQISSLTMWINKTYSEAGEVRLASKDWRDRPQVDFRLLSDRRDVDRLKAAFRRLARMFESPAVQAVASDPFPAAFSEKVRAVSVINRKNYILTSILAKFLDGPDFLRRALIRNVIMDGLTLEGALRDDDALEAFVKKAAVGVWHASCSCRMGADNDPMAVTDPTGRVRQVAGLRVVDASIFPVIPRANTNIPVIMAAEKIADSILSGE